MPSKIFISYRRDDVPGDARGVRDGLAAKFGKSRIFMDVDNLLVGQRFDIELSRALDDCDVLLIIVGPRWFELLQARAGSGERDYVVEEIAEAIKRRIPVVPIRVGREGNMPALPRPDQLPEGIRDFVHYQKHDVAHERFGRDMVELIAAISALRRATSNERRGGAAPRGAMAAAVAGSVLLAWAASFAAGWWGRADTSSVDSTSMSIEVERRRVADLQAEIERRDAELLKAEAERRRIEIEATQLREAEAKRKAEEVERLRQAQMIKDEEDRRRAEAEVKRKAEEAERQRLERQRAAAAAEAKRKADEEAKAAADAEARRRAEEAERQRLAALKAEQDRQRAAAAEAKRKSEEEAKAASEAQVRRKAEEAERERQIALKAERDRKQAEVEARQKAEEAAWITARREGTIRKIHTPAALETIYSISLSPNGAQAIFGSDSGRMKVWNVFQPSSLGTLVLSSRRVEPWSWAAVRVSDISKDGKYALTGDHDGFITIFDLHTWQEVRSIQTYALNVADKWVLAASFAPDGKTVVSAGSGTTLKLWNVATGERIKSFTGAQHQHRVWSVAFSEDGKLVASTDRGGQVKIWDVSSGRLTQTLSFGRNGAEWVAFWPLGKPQPVVPKNSGVVTAKITGNRLVLVSPAEAGAAFSADAMRLVTPNLELIDLTSGTLIASAPRMEHSPYSMSMSSDGQRVAVSMIGGKDGVFIWDLPPPPFR